MSGQAILDLLLVHCPWNHNCLALIFHTFSVKTATRFEGHQDTLKSLSRKGWTELTSASPSLHIPLHMNLSKCLCPQKYPSGSMNALFWGILGEIRRSLTGGYCRQAQTWEWNSLSEHFGNTWVLKATALQRLLQIQSGYFVPALWHNMQSYFINKYLRLLLFFLPPIHPVEMFSCAISDPLLFWLPLIKGSKASAMECLEAMASGLYSELFTTIISLINRLVFLISHSPEALSNWNWHVFCSTVYIHLVTSLQNLSIWNKNLHKCSFGAGLSNAWIDDVGF